MKKTTKIGIIGAGHVGSHVASSLMTQGLCDEIVLLDTDEGKARRHADDIADTWQSDRRRQKRVKKQGFR